MLKIFVSVFVFIHIVANYLAEKHFESNWNLDIKIIVRLELFHARLK